MRIQRWNAKEIFQGYIDQAEENANIVMDEVAEGARQRLGAGVKQIPPIVRRGKFAGAIVEFTPKTGRGKGTPVTWFTDKRWTGRRSLSANPRDQLYASIRRRNKPGSGNVRVYEGSELAYWAFMVEKTGYTDRSGKFHQPLHFLQGSFQAMKQSMLSKIVKG